MDVDFDELDDRTLEVNADAHPETARILADLDRKRAARQLALPTNDLEVRNLLRAQGEPITLFGERPEDRRDRLRQYLAKAREGADEAITRYGEGDLSSSEEDSDQEMDEREKEEEFYTEGTLKLKAARRNIAQFSLPRARQRVARQRKETQLPLGRLIDVRKAVYGELKSFTNLGSQIGDSRALSSLRFSPDSSMLLTASWTGMAKLWTVPGCREIKTFKAHKERIGGVAWHPSATLSQSKTAVNFATSGADNDVKLWALEGSADEPLQTLSGHSARVCKIGFHPSGKYLGSASYDGTWRLWDVETGAEELLLQEGHSKEVYAIAFQDDGALVCTGGLDAIGRVWDLRSGKTAMVLDGHVKDILAIDFSPNGHQIATGSNDDTIRIWDMRSLKSIYTIPAHKSAVSDLKFFSSQHASALPRAFARLDAFGEAKRDPIEVEGEKVDYPLDGSFLVSSGYDGAVKLWSADDWQHLKTLSNDGQGKVMTVDVSSDARLIASGEYSRTYKLWSHPDVDLSSPA